MPKRLTIPEDRHVLILTPTQRAELYELMKGIRQRGASYLRDNAQAVHAVAGEIMLAIVKGEE